MLTMLPSGYNINTAGLSQHHRVRGRVGGDALAGVGFPPQLTTEPMTGPTVPAAGGGATRVRTLMARPAGPRPHTPHYNVISNRSGRRPRHPPPLAGHFDRVVISGAQSVPRPDRGPIKKSLDPVSVPSCLILEVDPRSSLGQSSEFGLMTRSVAEDVGDCLSDRAPPREILRSTKKSPKLFGGCRLRRGG